MATAEHFSIRQAVTDDHSYILDILEEVSPEIPLRLDSSERIDAIKNIIVQCCDSGDTLVATDGAGKVVGFVLAKPDIHEWAPGISMRYVGVAKSARRAGIFSALLEELKASRRTLTATVLHGNQSGMADRLRKAGFAEVASNERERSFRWTIAPESQKV